MHPVSQSLQNCSPPIFYREEMIAARPAHAHLQLLIFCRGEMLAAGANQVDPLVLGAPLL